MTLEEILAGFAGRSGLGVLAPEDDGAYRVVFDEFHDVDIIPLGQAHVQIQADVAGTAPGASGADEALETLMRANLARLYRRREVLTLDPRDARVRLSRLEPLGGLDVDRFLGVIEELLDSLDLFRDAVEDRSRGPDPSPHGSIRLP